MEITKTHVELKSSIDGNPGLRLLLGILALGLSLSAAPAKAEDVNTERSSLSDLKPATGNKVPGSEEVDELLTNNNLRALSGSTARLSIASQFNYNGGTINSAFSENRPNISLASGNTLKSDLDGSISVKYNLTAKDALLTGVGVRWIAPLSKNGPSNYNGTTYDVMNPYLVYQHIYKWLGVQSVIQVTGTQWTQADQTALGYDKQLNIDQENIYELGTSGVSVGASLAFQYQTFNKSGSYLTPSNQNYLPDIAAAQSVWLVTVAPELEYQLTSKVNLRTLINPWTFEHYRSQNDRFAVVRDAAYQSIGVGFSVTRNVFLYPNVQFTPQHVSADLTNAGISATVNLD